MSLDSADRLAQLFHEILGSAICFDHSLVVAAALDGRTGAYKLTEDSIEVELPFLVGVTFDEFQVDGDELKIPLVLLRGPVLVVILEISPGAKPAFFWFVEPWADLLHSFFVLHLVCGIGEVV